MDAFQNHRCHRSSAPVGDAFAKASECEMRDGPTNQRNGDHGGVIAQAWRSPKQRSSHDLNTMIDRIEMDERHAHHALKLLYGPKDRCDEHGDLHYVTHQLLDISKTQAQHAEQERRPNAIE